MRAFFIVNLIFAIHVLRKNPVKFTLEYQNKSLNYCDLQKMLACHIFLNNKSIAIIYEVTTC